MSVSASCLACSELQSDDIGQMFEVFENAYDDVCRVRFEQDVKDKTHCIVLRNADEAIVGFSTLKLYDVVWKQQPRRVIFSGDTIIQRAYWGSQQLAFAWSHLAGELWRQAPETPLYWFLICKGHRTYRYLRAMMLDYAPRVGVDTDPEMQAWMDYLAHLRFGQAYNPQTGLVRFDTPQGRLTSVLAEIPATHLRLPDVAFFLQKNPHYACGDELVCVSEIAPGNVRPFALRLFNRSLEPS